MRFAFFEIIARVRIMKVSLFCALLLLCLAATAGELQLGDDRETALNKLGKPIGSIDLRGKTRLIYPSGQVVLVNDVVTEFDLMSESEYAAEQARLKNEREQWQLENARRRATHTAEGQSIRAAKRGSTAFAALPAKDRVDYWRSFQLRYPEVDVSEELWRALASYQTELAELNTRQEIAQLQARVAQAEKEAANALRETRRLQAEAERNRQAQNFSLRYYRDPVVVYPHLKPRPPVITIISNGETRIIQHTQPET